MLINNTEPNNAIFELSGEQYIAFDTTRNCLVVHADSTTMSASDVNGLVEFGYEMGNHPDRYPSLEVTVDLGKCVDNILDGNVMDDGAVEPLLIPELNALKAQLLAALNKINAVLPATAL